MNFTTAGTAELIALGVDGLALLELDPADVSRDADGMADPMEDALVLFLSAVDDYPGAASVVWSDTHTHARAVCPSCDDVFDVYDGLSIIMADEGTRVCQECEDADDDA